MKAKTTLMTALSALFLLSGPPPAAAGTCPYGVDADTFTVVFHNEAFQESMLQVYAPNLCAVETVAMAKAAEARRESEDLLVRVFDSRGTLVWDLSDACGLPGAALDCASGGRGSFEDLYPNGLPPYPLIFAPAPTAPAKKVKQRDIADIFESILPW